MKQVRDLSGGERRRLGLAVLVTSGANFLVLDEPTNHLDLDSRETLEAALEGFPGTVLLVSHDRALLDAVAQRTAAIEDGTVRVYDGGWADLVRAREEREEAQRRRGAPTQGAARRSRRRRAKPGRDPLAAIEAEIERPSARSPRSRRSSQPTGPTPRRIAAHAAARAELQAPPRALGGAARGGRRALVLAGVLKRSAGGADLLRHDGDAHPRLSRGPGRGSASTSGPTATSSRTRRGWRGSRRVIAGRDVGISCPGTLARLTEVSAAGRLRRLLRRREAGRRGRSSRATRARRSAASSTAKSRASTASRGTAHCPAEVERGRDRRQRSLPRGLAPRRRARARRTPSATRSRRTPTPPLRLGATPGRRRGGRLVHPPRGAAGASRRLPDARLLRRRAARPAIPTGGLAVGLAGYCSPKVAMSASATTRIGRPDTWLARRSRANASSSVSPSRAIRRPFARSTTLRVSSASESDSASSRSAWSSAWRARAAWIAGQQVRLAERLDEIAEDARLDRAGDELLLAVGGEHHDRDRPLGEDAAGGLDPVEPRHLHVEDGEVGLAR